MDKLSLQAQERIILGKKVKALRKNGKLPGHVYGRGIETEHVSVDQKIFLQTLKVAGETGLIYLQVGDSKVKPVMVKGVQYDPVSGQPVHIDFYQVNLTEKVKVPVPLVLIGEEPESVKLGETIVLQTLSEVEVEALPTDLIEKIEVDITNLKNIDDAVTVGQLNYDRSKLTIHAEEDGIVVKIAPAITEEMKKQLEEQAAEAAAASAETTGAEGAAPAEGEEGQAPASAEATAGKPAEGEQPKAEGGEGKEEAPKE